MKAEYINPFISATADVVKQMAQLDVKRGQIGLKKVLLPSYEVVIKIDVVGDLQGSVVYSMAEDVAKRIASSMMMGMPVNALDDLAKSAVNELANMITGNAASKLNTLGITVDITPPSMNIGRLAAPLANAPALVIPMLVLPQGTIEVNVTFKGE